MRYRVLLAEKQATAEVTPGAQLLLAWQGPGWNELRQRLARAARELHFVAYSGDSANTTFLLSFSERFAELALSIPISPERKAVGVRFPGDLVDAKTLLAAHILQYDALADSETDE